MINQNPEQKARDIINKQLIACSWIIQDKKKINLVAGLGIAIREYQTDIGPADYVLFVDKKADENTKKTNITDQNIINQVIEAVKTQVKYNKDPGSETVTVYYTIQIKAH